MTTLRVWTHWIAAPGSSAGAPLTRPASLATYTPAPSPLAVKGVAPQYRQDWATSPIVTVWAELAKQGDINTANWGGPGWPGAPPSAWPPPPVPPVGGDEGYSAAAVSFRITALSVILRNTTNTEFTFTLRNPAGNVVGIITPASPQSSPGIYPVTGAGGSFVPVPNGKGIWTVDIERIPGSGVAEPALYLGGPPGNPVLPTYVSPYGNQYEGILGLQFEGEEVICPTMKTLATEVEVHVAGVATWQPRNNLVGLNCVTIGQKVRLTATYANPAPPAGTVYDWDFGDSTIVPNTAHPVNTQEHTYTVADVYAAAVSLQMPGCSTLQTKPVEACYRCPTKVEIQPPSPQPLVVTGCAPGSAEATFNVVVTWPVPPPPNPVQMDHTWIINGPTGKYEITTNAPNVSTAAAWTKTSVSPNLVGPVDIGTFGGYSVAVTVNVVNIRQGCTLVDTRQFTVPACVPCPQVSITAPSVQGFAEQNAVGIFTAQIPMGPGAPVPTGYRWTITHTASGRQATVVTTTDTMNTSTTLPAWTGTLATGVGAVDLTTPGSYTVKLTALYAAGVAFPPNCDPSTIIPFTVPSIVAPPTVSGCSVTAGTPGTVTVTFDSPVNPTSANNPANYSVSINGAPAATPAAGTVSYNAASTTTTLSGFTLAAGASVVVTVSNVTDPSGTVIIGNPKTSTCAAPPTGGTGTPPTGGGGASFLCGALLLLALLMLGIAGVGLALWGCLGAAGLALLAPALSAATVGLIVLALWIAICRDCPVIRFLQRFFGAMALLLLVLAAIFTLVAMVGCSLGAAAVAALFGTIVGVLTVGAGLVGCP